MNDKDLIVLIKYWLKTKKTQEIPKELGKRVTKEDVRILHTQLKRVRYNKLDYNFLRHKLSETEQKIIQKENQKNQNWALGINVFIAIIMLITAGIMFNSTGIADDSLDVAKRSINLTNETFNLYTEEMELNFELINKQLELINNQLEPQIYFQVIPSKWINTYRDNFTVRNIDITDDFSLDLKIINVGEKTVQIRNFFFKDDCFDGLITHGLFDADNTILTSNNNITYVLNTSKEGMKKYFANLYSINKSCVVSFHLIIDNEKYIRYLMIDKP